MVRKAVQLYAEAEKARLALKNGGTVLPVSRAELNATRVAEESSRKDEGRGKREKIV